MGRVQGKTVIVTGGGLGIGRATCLLLAGEGAKVAVTDILDDAGQEVAREAQSKGGTARFWHLDVADEAAVQRVFADVSRTFGSVDVLVNNAGITGQDKPTDQLTLEDWRRVMSVNVEGVFLCTRAAVPLMRQRGSGSIINLSSIYGIVGAPDIPAYHASKGAVRLMTKTDALLYARDGIRVNSVHPGYIWGDSVRTYLQAQADARETSFDDVYQEVAAQTALHHLPGSDEIAQAVVFLASEKMSSSITGESIDVNAGQWIR